MPDDEIFVDASLLRRVARRRLRAWLLAGPLLLAVLTGLGLGLVPQSFTSTASVAVQQPGPAAGALSLLGAQPQTKRYLGILKSRRAALYVVQRVDLQRLYALPTTDDALDFLVKHVTPNDSAADGLLYIDVTLPGPPALAPGAARRRQAVREAAADAANSYTDALRLYYASSDTDRDAVLLRGADVEVSKARAAFDQASARVQAFALTLGRYDPRALPGAGVQAGVAPGAAAETTEAAKLYESLAQVQVQIRAAQAAQAAQQRLVAGQLSALPQVPGEDPLLNDARSRVLLDRTQLANLRVQFGPDNPQVVVARQRLLIDQATLARQMRGVRDNLTTEHVAGAAELESLRARQATLEAQIARADDRLQAGRRLSVDLARLQAEAELRLETLKATMAEAAKVRLDNVSAESRMSVVDDAVVDRHPRPGALLLAGISAVLVVLVFLLLVARDYRKGMQAVAGGGWLPAASAPVGIPEEPAGEDAQPVAGRPGGRA